MNKTENSENPVGGIPASDLQKMQLAAAAHNEGDLKTAETFYRQVLEEDPQNPDALHLLGFLWIWAFAGYS